MKHGALRAHNGLTLQVGNLQVFARLTNNRENAIRMGNTRYHTKIYAVSGSHQKRSGIHHGGSIKATRCQGLSLLSTRVDHVPVHFDAFFAKVFFEQFALLHHDVLKVKGALHIGDVELLGHFSSGKGGTHGQGQSGHESFEVFHGFSSTLKRIGKEKT